MRIAILNTPRSGSTWLRRMLAEALELQEHLVPSAGPCEVPWDRLPSRAIIHLHWPHDRLLEERLRRYGFRVVVVARHPLDTLISILVYSQHDASAGRWLGSNGAEELSIEGASPTSDEFLQYAVSPRAAALLAVSTSWWQYADVCRVRYEELAADTRRELERIVSFLGEPPRQSLDQIVQLTRPHNLRPASLSMLFHIWQAQPGLWRQLIPAAEANSICNAHRWAMELLGYVCDPQEALTKAEAQRLWQAYDGAAMKRNIRGLKQEVNRLREIQEAIGAELGKQVETLTRQIAELQAEQEANQERLQASQKRAQRRNALARRASSFAWLLRK